MCALGATLALTEPSEAQNPPTPAGGCSSRDPTWGKVAGLSNPFATPGRPPVHSEDRIPFSHRTRVRFRTDPRAESAKGFGRLHRDRFFCVKQLGALVTTDVVVGKDVWKTYGSGETEVTALRGVNATIRRGELLAIMGPSGCGKTTFLNCFSRLGEI